MPTDPKSLLMSANQTSTLLFNGERSAWSLLLAARRQQIPHIRVGKRVFFSPEAIREWIRERAEESVKTGDPETVNGIRRLK